MSKFVGTSTLSQVITSPGQGQGREIESVELHFPSTPKSASYCVLCPSHQVVFLTALAFSCCISTLLFMDSKLA